VTASQLRPASDAGTPLPPPDGRLPGLTALLDVPHAAEVLSRSSPDIVDGLTIRKIRYKPGRRLVVEYDVRSRSATSLAVAIVDSKRDLRELAASAGLSWEADERALVQWYPVDVALPALAVPPEELAGEGPSRLLGYKPLERATLRVGSRVVKLYRSRHKLRRAVTALETLTESGIPGTELLEVSETFSATMHPFVPGGTPDTLGGAVRAAALVRRLHDVAPRELEVVGANRRLDAAARSGAVVAAVAPVLRRRVSLLIGRLERSLPSVVEHVTAHGDFEPGQIVESDELALVDLDDCCATSRADDLGWYAAHAARGHDGDPEAVAQVVDALVEGYGSRPAELPWYVSTSLLARAAFPFRRQEPGWPERVERVLSAAESARPSR
jgi:hypothetical protein